MHINIKLMYIQMQINIKLMYIQIQIKYLSKKKKEIQKVF